MDSYKTQTYLASSGRNLDKDGLLDDATKSKSKRVSGVDKMKRHRNLTRKHHFPASSNQDHKSGTMSTESTNTNYSSSRNSITVGPSNSVEGIRATTNTNDPRHMDGEKSNHDTSLGTNNHKRLPLQVVDMNSPKRMTSSSMTAPLGSILKHSVRNRQPSPSVSPLQQEQTKSLISLEDTRWVEMQGEENNTHAMFQSLSESIKQDNNRNVHSWYTSKGKQESLSHFSGENFLDEFGEFMEEMARELSVGHVEVRQYVCLL